MEIVADASGVYWTNRLASGDTVMTAAVTGGSVRTLAKNQTDPYGITTDSVAVYWTNSSAGQVMKVAK